MTLLVYEKCKWKSSHPREGVVSCSVEDIGCPRHPDFSAGFSLRRILHLSFSSFYDIRRLCSSFIISLTPLKVLEILGYELFEVFSRPLWSQSHAQFLIGHCRFVISFHFNGGFLYFSVPLMKGQRDSQLLLGSNNPIPGRVIQRHGF